MKINLLSFNGCLHIEDFLDKLFKVEFGTSMIGVAAVLF